MKLTLYKKTEGQVRLEDLLPELRNHPYQLSISFPVEGFPNGVPPPSKESTQAVGPSRSEESAAGSDGSDGGDRKVRTGRSGKLKMVEGPAVVPSRSEESERRDPIGLGKELGEDTEGSERAEESNTCRGRE